MLLYIKEDGDIFNLDNMTRIYPDEYFIRYDDNRIKGNTMVVCDDSDQAFKIVEWIYHRMTLGNGNAILDLEEFRKEETETAKTRKALNKKKSCATCLYLDTDGCKQWYNTGTGCDAHITIEEAMKDVNEEK